MKEFDFYLPTKVIFRNDSIDFIVNILIEKGLDQVLLVTDKGVIDAGLVEPITQAFAERKIKFNVYMDVVKNPKIETVLRGVDEFNKHDSRCLVAIGGGSSIDTAKAIGILVTNGGSIEDYEGFGQVNQKPPFLVAIPTTYGTGSEVSTTTIITNENKHYKMFIGSDLIAPDYAIIDPNLTVALPFDIAVSTGLDTLTHAIESYVSKNENPISDALNIKVIETVVKYLAPAASSNDNLEATSQMITASALAAIAFNYTALGLVHAIAHALGGLYDLPHGIANAVLLPYVMKFNLLSKPSKFSEVAKAMQKNINGLSDLEAAELSVQAVHDLSGKLGIPQRLRELGVTRDSFTQIALYAANDGNVTFNPRSAGEQEILSIIEDAY